jgi:predicted phosphoadenosine phosphosulfate sulfurtransferase
VKIPQHIMNESVYIFLVDRTGSMQGRKLDITKEALKLFIQSLPAGCLFEIVSFGYNFCAATGTSSFHRTKRGSSTMMRTWKLFASKLMKCMPMVVAKIFLSHYKMSLNILASQ